MSTVRKCWNFAVKELKVSLTELLKEVDHNGVLKLNLVVGELEELKKEPG